MAAARGLMRAHLAGRLWMATKRSGTEATDSFTYSATHAVLIGIAAGAGLFLAWMAAGTLFLIFAGLLFAALLDACARGLARVLPIHRHWNLTIVCIGLVAAFVAFLVWSGFSVALQIDQFVQALNQQLQSLGQSMVKLGVIPAGENGKTPTIGDLSHLLFANPNQLFGEAQGAFSRTIGGLGDAVIIVLIGIFVAADPLTYKHHMVELLPLRQRKRVGLLLDETATVLRRWLVGQFAAMVLLAILTAIVLVALRVPSPALLGIQAGLFEFIPYLGAVVGAVPILLLALPLGSFTLWTALGLYAVVHFAVGNVMVPMIQKRTLDLPPAVALASLAIFGVLFGLASVAVATPVVVAIRHAILRLRELPADDDVGRAERLSYQSKTP
jgi:predicted PurR-regulated permease PerM